MEAKTVASEAAVVEAEEKVHGFLNISLSLYMMTRFYIEQATEAERAAEIADRAA